MLSKKLKMKYVNTIVTFFIFTIAIIAAYVYAIINLTFNFMIIILYIVFLIGSVIIFTIRLAHVNKYIYKKPIKVKSLKRPLDLPPVPEMFHGLMVRRGPQIPYFLLKQNDKGIWIYHDVLEAIDQYQTFQLIQHNYVYALLKDTYGHYYITYLNDLEIDDARTQS